MWDAGVHGHALFQFGDRSTFFSSLSLTHHDYTRNPVSLCYSHAVTGSVSHPCSEPVRCHALQQEAVGWNNMLFAGATLADLDRLDPERLFCLTQSNDKSASEIVFLFLRNMATVSAGTRLCVCERVCLYQTIFLSMSANKQLPSHLTRLLI